MNKDKQQAQVDAALQAQIRTMKELLSDLDEDDPELRTILEQGIADFDRVLAQRSDAVAAKPPTPHGSTEGLP